eukprot:2186382-Pleurochrysis_carterae.AAC.2
MPRRVGGHAELVSRAERALRIALGAELAHGEKCVVKRRCATHVPQDDGASDAERIGGQQVEIPDDSASFGQLIDPHHVFPRRPGVREIGFGRMYVPGATAVDDESQPAVDAAFAFEPVVPPGEQCPRRGRGHGEQSTGSPSRWGTRRLRRAASRRERKPGEGGAKRRVPYQMACARAGERGGKNS